MHNDMKQVNIAIFVSGSGSNCENLIRYFSDKQVNCALVVSNKPEAYALVRAERLGVPTAVMPKADLNDEQKMMQLMRDYQVDFIVLAGFLPLIPNFLIDAYPRRIVNLHPALLPKYEILDNDYYAEDFVTEENYDIVRANISIVMGEKDDYLDVFMEDMKYSETPILATVSENLADIYQELKNFVMAYKNATNEGLMMNALAEVKEGFQFSWGQKLVNVQRALHEVRYSEEDEY